MCGCYVVFDNGNKDAMYNVQVPVRTVGQKVEKSPK